jgi:hypothetical protein
MATSFRASARRLYTATRELSATLFNSTIRVGSSVMDDLGFLFRAMNMSTRTVVTCLTLPLICYVLLAGSILIMATFANAAGHWWTPAVDNLANRECKANWLSDDNITPLCRSRPGDYSCALGRAWVTQAADVAAMLRFRDFDKFVLDNTLRLDVKCAIWSRTRPSEWNEYSSRPYQKMACDCMEIAANPGYLSNLHRYCNNEVFPWLSRIARQYCYTIILTANSIGCILLVTIVSCFRGWFTTKQTTNQIPLYIKWSFDKAKYHRKVAEGHTHPWLNTARSCMRAGVASRFVKDGAMINLFGCRDDLKDVNSNGNSMKNFQVRTAYNAGARTAKGTIMFDTYELAIAAAVKEPCGRYFIWDAAHFLTANHVATILNNGGVMVFNVRQGPIGVSKIFDPLSGRQESAIESDGNTWCEQVMGGDAYAHNHLSLPNCDQFCLDHRGNKYLFTRAKVVDDDSYSKSQFVYTASQCGFQYSDGRLASYFKPLHTGVKLLTAPAGQVVGAIIPSLHDGKSCTRRLTDDEFKAVIQSTATPSIARDWDTTVTGKLIIKELPSRDLDSLLKLAHMLKARQVLTSGVGLPLTWQQAILHNMRVQAMCWARGVWGRLPIVGHEVVSVTSCRVVTEGALAEEAAGSNSQEAGPGADATSGVDTSSSAKRGGQPGGRNGDRRTEATLDEGTPPTVPPKAPNRDPRGTPPRTANALANARNNQRDVRGVDEARERPNTRAGPRPGARERNGLGGGRDGSVLAAEAAEGPPSNVGAPAAGGDDGAERGLPDGPPQQAPAGAASLRSRVGVGRGKGSRGGVAGQRLGPNPRR